METNPQIKLFQKMLKKLFISSCIFSNPKDFIPPKIDLYLRKNLYGNTSYTEILQNSFENVKANTIYRFFDEYDCHYIFLCLSKKQDKYIFIGPYLLDLPSKERIKNICNFSTGSNKSIEFLEQYYNNLPIINNENLILTLTDCLAQELWGIESEVLMEYVDYVIPDKFKPIATPFIPTSLQESEFDLKILEQNYANEKLLMDAVSTGKLHRVLSVSDTIPQGAVKSRLADSLRDKKNYLVILKTLLRKAAEFGGVHPLHIDKLSSKYAYEIENLRTINQSIKLQDDMIRAFCLLVKDHSLKRYSYYVRQTITLVQYDLSADLRLKAIAEKLNVNASYLSDLFHREYGQTLTDFIIKERINHGAHLLNSTEKSVQEIAAECGIFDASYFIKLFKKQTEMTPKQYKKLTKTN